MGKSWGCLVKRCLLCVTVGVLWMCAGTAITSVLVLQEIVDFMGAAMCLYATLVTGSFALCWIANIDRDGMRIQNVIIGVASMMLPLAVGYIVFAGAGEGSAAVPALGVASGGILFMLLKRKENGGQRDGRKITKMVKMYKNVTR